MIWSFVMKIRFLLIGTSLSLIPQTINAQCVATQDCATLGYTETSCSGGSGVKCPFGNWWACFKSESEFCNEYGFTLTCTGTNQTGVGKACNNKYTECTCTSGYVWNASSQQCEDPYVNCIIGALYYADDTCSNDYIPSKKLLGIVIYEKSASQNGWVMTVNRVKTGIEWGGYKTDISGITNYVSIPTDIQASCSNTDIITAEGGSSKYPAAWAAKNYTEGGKTWCLPSGGLLENINNYSNFSKVNAGISIAKGTILRSEDIWSSSEYSGYGAWVLKIEADGSISTSGSSKSYSSGRSVRPVMSF